MFKHISGTKDILPPETYLWQKIESIARKDFALYNYSEIRTPLIEDAGLFNRSLGASTEIVQKQMFLIHNQEDLYALRPEGTASVVRGYIENNLHKTEGFVKFYYIGPMFRFERPQKGRLRQFHHIGCEVIGTADPRLDVEVISLANQLLKDFSITGYKIKINSLGCVDDKQNLSRDLKEKLTPKKNQLCGDCQERLNGNVLRILDCKNEPCQEVIEQLELKNAHLCAECAAHFNQVLDGLNRLNIAYEFNPRLVRGLDYYNRTVFEISHGELGSQDALGAGGRYNNLVKELGGPDIGAMGFAFGVERLLLVTSHRSQVISGNLTYLITLGEEAKKEGLKLLNELRAAEIACDTDYENRSLKGAMRKADDLKAKYVLILGDDELNKKAIMLKDMKSGEQREIMVENLIKELKC